MRTDRRSDTRALSVVEAGGVVLPEEVTIGRVLISLRSNSLRCGAVWPPQHVCLRVCYRHLVNIRDTLRRRFNMLIEEELKAGNDPRPWVSLSACEGCDNWNASRENAWSTLGAMRNGASKDCSICYLMLEALDPIIHLHAEELHNDSILFISCNPPWRRLSVSLCEFQDEGVEMFTLSGMSAPNL